MVFSIGNMQSMHFLKKIKYKLSLNNHNLIQFPIN